MSACGNRPLAGLWLLLFLCLPELAAALPAGSSVIPPQGTLAFVLSGGEAKAVGSALSATAQHPDFKESLICETRAGAKNLWDAQIETPISAPVEAGDVLLASFWIRALRSSVESGEARTQFVFELNRDPWDKSVEFAVNAVRAWRRFDIPFKAGRRLAAGEAHVVFRMGYAPQAFEVGGIRVVNYGRKAALEQLPVTKLSYAGREADAPWRRAAQERILKLRTGPLVVKVLDAQGRPLAGAEVSVRQTRSAFHFGSAVSAEYLFGAGANDGRYASELKRLFNTVTEENAWKWPPLAGDWGERFNLALAKRSAAFAAENGLYFRGHCLFWPSWEKSPRSLKALESDKAGLRRAILDHVRETVEAAKPVPGEWDVLNELYDNHQLTDILGEGVIVDAFKAAHAADPQARLYINDNSILAGGGGDTPHRDHYEASIRSLLAAGAPLHGIGMQGHFGTNLTGIDDAKAILDRFGALGPKISVTEYDIIMDDKELAGDYTRDILTLVYSHPATEGFILWGFWDGAHPDHNAAFYQLDWRAKPALKAWEDLVLKAWRTQAAGKTDGQGRYELRGHLGDYEVSVRHGGAQKVATASLASPAGGEVVLRME